jgi:hypothetical protein
MTLANVKSFAEGYQLLPGQNTQNIHQMHHVSSCMHPSLDDDTQVRFAVKEVDYLTISKAGAPTAIFIIGVVQYIYTMLTPTHIWQSLTKLPANIASLDYVIETFLNQPACEASEGCSRSTTRRNFH